MRNSFKKVVVTGALVLASVVAVGSAMAAPNCDARIRYQVLKSPVIDTNSCIQSWGNIYAKAYSKAYITSRICENLRYRPQTNKLTLQSNRVQGNFAVQVVHLVNEERKKANLPPLQSDEALDQVAMIKAKDMYDNQYFAHHSPTLGSPFDLMASQGIRYRTAGENIAKGQRTPEDVVYAWMNSDGHRRNILNRNFTSIGVAYYGDVWVQVFKG